MKEHEHPYWNEKKREAADSDPYTAGSLDYSLGTFHAKKGHEFKPPREEHEDSYRQGYHEGDKTNRGNR